MSKADGTHETISAKANRPFNKFGFKKTSMDVMAALLLETITDSNITTVEKSEE